MSNFNSISFNPDNNMLSIIDNGTVVYSFNLCDVAVKLEVIRVSGQLKVNVETGNVSGFGTSRLELRMKYNATTTLPSIRFGEPQQDVIADIGGSQTIADKTKLYLIIIGSDDIRNNRSGGQTLRMEGDIISLGIDTATNMVVVRYHDSIAPNV